MATEDEDDRGLASENSLEGYLAPIGYDLCWDATYLGMCSRIGADLEDDFVGSTRTGKKSI
jgi:hypothetical protein